MAIGANGFKELGIVVKDTCKLVSVAFIKIRAQSVIPFQRFVAVQCVTTTDANVVEELVGLHQSANLSEIGHRALVPCRIVSLVERSDRYYVKSFSAAIVYGSLEQANPFRRFSYIILSVLLSIAIAIAQHLMVTVECNVCHAGEADESQAVVKVSFLL